MLVELRKMSDRSKIIQSLWKKYLYEQLTKMINNNDYAEIKFLVFLYLFYIFVEKK